MGGANLRGFPFLLVDTVRKGEEDLRHAILHLFR